MRNFQEQVKQAFCYQKFFWPFTVCKNCSSDIKNFANSWSSASKFKSFSQSLEEFVRTVGKNNFGNKIPFTFNPKALNEKSEIKSFWHEICKYCFKMSAHFVSGKEGVILKNDFACIQTELFSSNFFCLNHAIYVESTCVNSFK